MDGSTSAPATDYTVLRSGVFEYSESRWPRDVNSRGESATSGIDNAVGDL
jgi:hypothetical protein